jgi:hypothetical protein
MDNNTKAQQHHQNEQHAHVEHVRDDLTWTQFITNLAANKLAPPKSQTLKVLEDHLARLSEELYVKGEERTRERLQGGDGNEKDAAFQERAVEKGDGARQGGLAAGAAETLAQNQDLVRPQEAPSLALGTAEIQQFSFTGSQDVARPTGPAQQLHQQLSIGNRWIDVLWQFIAAQQKRLIDPERLGIEPSERMDIQVDMIRKIAASYEKLGMLTRLPDSLSEARECKVVDDIRTMALVYVARSMMDVASPKEIADAEDDDTKKPVIEFPRSVISPYEGIRPIEFDPMELIMAA